LVATLRIARRYSNARAFAAWLVGLEGDKLDAAERASFFCALQIAAAMVAKATLMGEILIECHAGYRADERPLRFTLRGRVFEVAEVQDRWYSPGALYFRVRTADGDFYILRHDEGLDVWTLEGFRASLSTGTPADMPDGNISSGPHGAS
jgi:hypothetical protein